MREKLVCQKDVARKKLDNKAIYREVFSVYLVNNSLVSKYRPRTVKMPARAATILIDQTETPKIEAECGECGNPITKAEAQFSKRIFKKQLCRSCQTLKKK